MALRHGLLVAAALQAGVSAMTPEDRRYYGAGCTSLALGKGATKDGSTMVSHGNDCPTCDFRLAWVPPRDYPEGARMNVYMAKNDYPRWVGEDRGELYKKANLEQGFPFTWKDSVPMGDVPQVRHTYGYVDGAYGIMNEHQLAFGESTCDALLGPKGVPIAFGGSALFDAAALSRVALERCKTARCAVRTMGELAVQYGFYGGQLTDWTPVLLTDDSEGGESLSVSDPDETWVFQISPDDSGKSAIWVAQRVPDGELTVVTNTFSIGQIDLQEEDHFMASANLFDVAERATAWRRTSATPFDWAQLFRSPRKHSLPDGHTLADRRKWEVFNRVAPSRKFDPYPVHAWDDSDMYFPFSVKPDHPLSEEEVFRLHRDVFQGTPFDMEMDVVAGPFGDPYRAKVPNVHPFNDTQPWKGGFERAISQTWTSYTVISQSRGWLPDSVGGRVWFGPHDAMTTLFTPVYPSAALQTGNLPESLQVGSLLRMNTHSLWWAVTTNANYAARFYSYALVNVSAVQREMEGQMLQACASAESAASKQDASDQLLAIHTLQERIGAYAVEGWWKAFFNLVAIFHDGSYFQPGVTTTIVGKVYYPKWWLQYIGPPGAHFAEWANAHPNPAFDTEHVGKGGARIPPLMPTNRLASAAHFQSTYASSGLSASTGLFVAVASLVAGLALRPLLDRRLAKEEYEAIP